MKKLAINGGKPIRKNFLPTSQPLITEVEIKEVTNTLKNGWLTTGPKVIEFEKKFKDYIGCKHAIAVNSGTSALHLSLILAGIGKGDEVITTPMSWVSTVNTIIYSRAKPIFVDIDKGTLNINPEKIKEAITKKTKAIMPVHMAGRACEMDRIQKIAKENNLHVIEDCAHAIETVY
ncbi:MAG: aminotransferase class I/II-fold pyridoxal phosphate-dependent enzyme, partial [Candidatus Aenigmarchaeota archaeon]|nr:aminotransferase class I/II-fold pyridoxal phosphate-dependent enzyme [Candidatus Aenigmarchaeota archaeon]